MASSQSYKFGLREAAHAGASNAAQIFCLQLINRDRLFPPSAALVTFVFRPSCAHSGDGNRRRLLVYGLFRFFGQSDHVSGGRSRSQPADALFEQFDSGPAKPAPWQRVELIRFEHIRFEHDRLSEADGDGSWTRHESSLCQNVMSTLDIRGHDGYSEVDRKQASTSFKCLDLAVTRPRTFRIENQITVHLLEKILTHRQTPPQRFGLRMAIMRLTINRYDIHESRDYEPRPPGVKEIIAGAEQCECGKWKPRSGHQNCTIDMARMIAADDERGRRKVMPPRDRQTTVTDEKHSAKGSKDGTTRRRRQEHLL
jgi:hypothetical protein